MALTALVILLPVMATIAFLVKIKLGSPVIFTQFRAGQRDSKTGQEKIFKIYKFRSMTDACDEKGNPLPDDVRLTKFGKKLRETSLDELPELLNIIKGDMSFVGPRPLFVDYLPYYTEEEHQRHNVRPGLTGLAQINGRNAIKNWEERFSYDLRYINSCTFIGDIKIFVLTIYKVIMKSDIQVGKEIASGRLDVARKKYHADKH